MKVDVIVIGGGAAGVMCAFVAGERGGTAAGNFISRNPHFAKSALARYTPADFVALVERHRIRYHEKKLGQLFCDESSRQVVGMLLAECDAAGVRVVNGCRVGGGT